ncbi:hypothetical protein J6590_022398 [Homalodisca vitripennis]|nr:hypothetical protein J6590_022398 [Homalodisca vitripennis]
MICQGYLRLETNNLSHICFPHPTLHPITVSYIETRKTNQCTRHAVASATVLCQQESANNRDQIWVNLISELSNPRLAQQLRWSPLVLLAWPAFRNKPPDHC